MLVACSPPVGTRSSPLTNSQLDSGHPSVGTLAGCGATLIGSRSVLTAAHCVGSGGAGFRFEAGSLSVAATNVVPHPSFTTDATLEGRPYEGGGWYDYDLAVGTLEREVTEPAPLQLASDAHQIGETIILVGFGSPASGETGGVKRTATNVIGDIHTRYFMYGDGISEDGKPSVLCHGDSGGPTLVREGAEERLLGVHSMQEPTCIEFGYDMRVPAFRAWLMEQTQGNLGVSAARQHLDAGNADGSRDQGLQAQHSGGCSSIGAGRSSPSRLIWLATLLGLAALRRRGRLRSAPRKNPSSRPYI
jgi:hypothetical protein